MAAHLLAMSSLEESRQPLHLEPVPPDELVNAAVDGAAKSFEDARVKLAADVDPEAPRVLADREQVGLVSPRCCVTRALIPPRAAPSR